MPRRIRVEVGDCRLEAALNDSESAGAIWEALPIAGPFHTWGDEIFLATTVTCGPEDPRAVVAAGDLAYWPPGKAFCIFYGKTPASTEGEIRPASPVNLIGTVIAGDPVTLRSAVGAGRIVIEKLED
jgi:hypothetical protein